MANKAAGFTLIELMITVVIVAVLASIAIPSYQSYIENARRADGQAALLDLYARMERFYAENNTYATATLSTGAATDVAANGGTANQLTSPEGFYIITIGAQNATTFTLNAAPTGAQVSDTTCGTLSINSLGTKTESGTGTVQQCWQ